VAYTKGAPEVILESCDSVLTASGVKKLDDATGRKQVVDTAQTLQARRCACWASHPNRMRPLKTAQTGMTFLGLAGMIDPPRPEAKEAIAVCAEAGIRPVMITGDHPLTAQAVARELGLLETADGWSPARNSMT
jgi:Ca2+-transporting ATPase